MDFLVRFRAVITKLEQELSRLRSENKDLQAENSALKMELNEQVTRKQVIRKRVETLIELMENKHD